MATQWAPGPLHSKRNKKVLFDLVVHSVGVSGYGHYTAQVEESVFTSGELNEAFSILGR